MQAYRQTDLQKLWEDCCTKLKEEISLDVFELWIAPIIPVSFEDGQLVLSVPNNMFSEWLIANYQSLISETISSITNNKPKITFETRNVSSKESSDPALALLAPLPKTETQQLFPKTNDEAKPQRKENFSNIFSRHYTFDSFVVGDTNRFAHGACLAVSSAPGTAYNPLFIHSPTGLGKTHLLKAVANEIYRKNKRAKLEYLFSEEFCNLYIDALQKKRLPAFRERFRKVDVLLIDDVHFFANKEGLQEEFFHTFNSLYGSHKQIVLASDRPPQEINGLEKRLVSRFEWGLTTDIQVPNYETRIAILRKKQQCQSIKFAEKILELLASRLKSNIRRLEGALLNLISYISVTGGSGKDMTCDIAEHLLANLFNEEAGAVINVEQIQRVVASHFDIRFADMSSKRRPSNIAIPRQVAMYLSRKKTDLSLSAIAEQFNKNHATILHAVSNIEKKMQDSTDFKREVAIIERKLI